MGTDAPERIWAGKTDGYGVWWEEKDWVGQTDTRSDLTNALQARVAELMEAVVVLQNHLENTLDDDAWDKIPVSIWNNVTYNTEATRAALKETDYEV